MIKLRFKKRKNYTSIYIDIEYQGVRKWEPIKNLKLTGDKQSDKQAMELADRILAKRMLEITSGEYDLEIHSGERDFLEYYKKVADENPDINKRVSLQGHLKNRYGRLTFKQINEAWWNDFKTYLRDDLEYAPSTIYTSYTTIRSIIKKAIQQRIILKDPMEFIKEKRPKTFKPYLTWEELQRLSDTECIKPVVKNAFLFSCYTGLRLSDIEALKKSNFYDGTIVLSMEKTDDPIIVEYEDWMIKRYIPDFNNKKPDDLIFNLPARSIMHPAIKSWAAAAKISKNVSYHTSRHTFATGILTYYGDIATASELLGHRDLETTQIYAKIINKKRREAIKSLPKLD